MSLGRFGQRKRSPARFKELLNSEGDGLLREILQTAEPEELALALQILPRERQAAVLRGIPEERLGLARRIMGQGAEDSVPQKATERLPFCMRVLGWFSRFGVSR